MCSLYRLSFDKCENFPIQCNVNKKVWLYDKINPDDKLVQQKLSTFQMRNDNSLISNVKMANILAELIVMSVVDSG